MPIVSDTLPNTEDPQAHALRDLTPRLIAMAREDVLRRTKLDASNAGMIAAASAKKLAPYRDELIKLFGPEASVLIDELPMLARACQQADIESVAAATPTDLSAMSAEVRRAYDLLMNDAEGLVLRGRIASHELDKARDLLGYEALIWSTLVLVQVLRNHWPQIAGHTPLTELDLERAQRAAQLMQDAMGARDQHVDRLPANELRLRALSLLVRAYTELRRKVSYLRWYEGDADLIVPSFWAGRGRRTKRRETRERDEDTLALEGPSSGPGVPLDPGDNPLQPLVEKKRGEG